MRPLLLIASLAALMALSAVRCEAELKAGAAVVDVTPRQFPVLVNGGMNSRTADSVTTPINARAIVVDDSNERIGIVVVDSCMMPRPLLDEAKHLAAQRTGIKPDRMLISATHTHTAPASMGCLGTDADSQYVPFLRAGLVEALVAAEANLEPAQVGWAVANAAEFTAVRRWIRRPDRLDLDPFGNPTVRANMHAGRVWDNVIGESGPEDPDLSLISLRATDGRPIALLANFSMHYYSGQKPLAADYFGLFSEGLKSRLATSGDGARPPFVGIMSHGCSGDIWRRDYTKPPEEQGNDQTIEEYTDGLLDIAVSAYHSIESYSDADLAMTETRMTLGYRIPDEQRLEWARRVMAEVGDRLPKERAEVYAREQIILHERQSTEIVVQALRIGEIGIATTPNETYALTGLKLKLQSPLPQTMVIELANGGDGYIPPPEQHLLGGYNTWPARSAGLEVQAEPKITEAALRGLEAVAARPRRLHRQSEGPAVEAIMSLKPVAYWRLDEFSGPWAIDSSGHNRDAAFEMPIAFFLEGPESSRFCMAGEANRAAHFAGGRLRARFPDFDDSYTVSLWCWNGMPTDGRDVTGWMFSRGFDHGLDPGGVHLGLGGTANEPGRLLLLTGESSSSAQTEIPRWTWNHVVLVRDAGRVRVHLNGREEPEIDVALSAAAAPLEEWFFGGRCDGQSGWEGRLDEIALFDRSLSPSEIAQLSARR